MHRKYIDIQSIVEGQETPYWMHTRRLTSTIPYNEAKDVWLSHAPMNDPTPVVLSVGQLAVLFPEDAHAPTHVVSKPTKMRKTIIKIAV